MPFNFAKNAIKSTVFLLILFGFFQACSSSEQIVNTTPTKVEPEKNRFDPLWYDLQSPSIIDSIQIAAAVFVQATNETLATELAQNEVKKALAKTVDDYAEQVRRNKSADEWDASKLITLRRFVYSYVMENLTIVNSSTKQAEIGFYAWSQASIDKIAFDQLLTEKFSL